MFAAASSGPPPRRKKRPLHGLRTVEVHRGRSGYGFTISGQHPCVLSCVVSGSPADQVGLHTGDFLMSVNGLDVARASHDDVVRLIGSSTDLLILQIAENCTSSDSSDEAEFQDLQKPPQKSKYINHTARGCSHHVDEVNKRHRDASDGRQGAGRYENSRTSRNHQRDHAKLRALSAGWEPEKRSQGYYDGHQNGKHQSRARGIENIDPKSFGGGPRSSKHVTNQDGVIRYRSPNTKHTIVTREARLGSNKSRNRQDGGVPSRRLPPPLPHVPHRHNNQLRHGDGYAQDVHDNGLDDNVDTSDYLRAIVGYIGSIEMPRETRHGGSKLQSIRGAVRRLRLECKINTMVLMEVATNGIRLINSMGSTVAHYAADRIAFSGVSPDDRRFFGIVTLHSADDDFLDESVPEDGLDIDSSSCHVFMVDPQLARHTMHMHKARNFGIHCTISPDGQRCMEFPRSAVPIIQCTTHLYERPSDPYKGDMAQIGAFAAPEMLSRRSASQNSGHNKQEIPQASAANDMVCVVEMPHNNTRQSETSFRYDLDPDQSGFAPDPGSMSFRAVGEPDLSGMIIGDRAPGVEHADPSPISVHRPDSSSSSYDNSTPQLSTLERLNVRARPNPKDITGENYHSAVEHVLENQNSASNLRRRVHKMLQQGRQPLSEHELGLGSDIVSRQRQISGHADTHGNTHSVHPSPLAQTSMGRYGSSHTSASTFDSPLTDSSVSPSRAQNASLTSVSSVSSVSGHLGTSKSLSEQSGIDEPMPDNPNCPPVPMRRPIAQRRGPKTPARPPATKSVKYRPKSTPPFKVHSGTTLDYPDGTDGYDSEPGGVFEGADNLQTLAPPCDQSGQPPTASEKDEDVLARRHSEGFSLAQVTIQCSGLTVSGCKHGKLIPKGHGK